MSSPRQAFVGVGANLGDRWAAIAHALAVLRTEPGVTRLESSAVYETAPVGFLDQSAFLNLVVGLETTLTPESLLAVLRRLELAAGRRRQHEIRWGPRPLDLDLLIFSGETRSTAELTLPHPRMWERPFVTIPLAELLARLPDFQIAPALRAKLPLALSAPGIAPWSPSP